MGQPGQLWHSLEAEGLLLASVPVCLGHGHRSASPVCYVWDFPVQVLWHAPLPWHCKPLRNRHLLLLQWPDCPPGWSAGAQHHGQGREQKGWHQLHFSLGTVCSPGVLPGPGAHPPWDAHTHCPSLSRYLGWHLMCGRSSAEGSLEESALAKMHTVVVCVFTLVFNKIRIARHIGVCDH